MISTARLGSHFLRLRTRYVRRIGWPTVIALGWRRSKRSPLIACSESQLLTVMNPSIVPSSR